MFGMTWDGQTHSQGNYYIDTDTFLIAHLNSFNKKKKMEDPVCISLPNPIKIK